MEQSKKAAAGDKGGVDISEFLKAFEDRIGKPGSRWVLVVDDDPEVRRVVSRSLTSVDADLQVHQAENGRDALDTLQMVRKGAGDPVLIVSDLQMPVMDGWTFIEQLRLEYEKKGKTGGVPLIVLSASSGQKGFFGGTSVHGDKCQYMPMITVAKEDCVKPLKYDAHGTAGLIVWVKHFLE